MKKLYTSILMLASLLCTGCNDWLDVKGETEAKEEDLFQKESGFQSALTGCYINMASTDLYGERLTMSNIESIANLWTLGNNHRRETDVYFKQHKYEEEGYTRTALDAIYNKLYNTITQANMLIDNLGKTGDVIEESAMRAVIEGEAYAIRAYCHLDVLRLFGQMPHNSTIPVELPYSETATIDVYPPYYSFADFVKKIEDDLTQAETLLKDNDPLFTYTFDQLATPSQVPNLDTYLMYRQLRLNYWAVRALRARLYQYVGETDKAHDIAMEIINAKDPKGQPLRPLKGEEDLSHEYFASPSECLFAMSKYDVADYANDIVYGVSAKPIDDDEQLVLRRRDFTQLYNGQDIAAHSRYLKVWNVARDNQGNEFAAIKKYYYEDSRSSLINLQIIPLLRMSELYLIAMECSKDLDEVNELYTAYMLDRNVLISGGHFTSLADVQSEIIDEYRREFYGEGLMFYVYKRTNTTKMMFRNQEVAESEYLLPVPLTEFNPNNMNKQ